MNSAGLQNHQRQIRKSSSTGYIRYCQRWDFLIAFGTYLCHSRSANGGITPA